MDDDGFKVDYSKLDLALARALAQTKKEPLTYMREQAGLIIKNIIQITPPGRATSKGVEPGLSAGKKKVKRDIKRIYGTPSEAWNLMKDKEAYKGQAKGFWSMLKAGETDRARDLFRAVTGEGFTAFDGGTLHQSRFRNGRVSSGRRGTPVYFVNDGEALKEYIEERQQKIGWLADEIRAHVEGKIKARG